MSTPARTFLSGGPGQEPRAVSGMRIVARRHPRPVLSDRQVVQLAGISLLIVLLCAGYALLGWMGFWLTAENQWAINTSFLWVSGAVVLIALSWPVTIALRRTFASANDR